MLKKLGLVFLLVLSGCTQRKDTLFEKKDLDFMVISDIHYLADELNDDGKAIMELMEEADGRNTPHIVDLFDKWIETVISEKPDMVFITGDISFNGEKKSHEEIADKLMQLKENNIEVFVLPGNHDIARYAYGFNGEEVYETAVTMEEDYRKIYEDFGYSKAMSIDPASLSYTLNLNEDYVAFMIDGRKSALPEESLEWLEKQVKTAKKQNQKILVFSHYNFLKHTTLFPSGFVQRQAEEIIEMIDQQNLVAFSGHMHPQHIAQTDTTSDIASSSFSMYPFQYGKVSLKDDILNYNCEKLKLSEEENQKERNFYLEIQEDKVFYHLNGLDNEEKKVLKKYAAEMNEKIFTGTLTKDELNQAEFQRWMELNNSFSSYMNKMIEEWGEGNQHTLHVQLKD